MVIGFDAKRYFNNRTGLGNYSRSMVAAFLKNHPENKYVLFAPGRGPKPAVKAHCGECLV